MEASNKDLISTSGGGEQISLPPLPSEDELLAQIMITVDNVWKTDLSKRDIDKWLSNFTGQAFDLKYERQIALWLLVNFVYYNENEVRHLCRVLYHNFIHQMLQCSLLFQGSDIPDSLEQLENMTRFYHLGRPGESGTFILYYFRQENRLPLTSFISHPLRLPERIKVVAFIDDVTLSGSQASKYLERETRHYDNDKIKVLLTFFSTQESIRLLREDSIEVISCTTLDDRSRCFSGNSSVFYHFPEHLKNAELMALTYGRKLYPSDPLGYKNGQYFFGFFYNTPDNTLPIFWADGPGWTPVIRRYQKIFSGGIENDIGRFL